MKLAPIVLFVYNRPSHTFKTIEALRQNAAAERSELIVYSDAARDAAGARAVREIRSYVRAVKGFCSVNLVEREQSYGLARSIVAGVTETIGKSGRAVILEDDMVVSPYFLQYMNDALALYESNEEVISVHSYVYPVRGGLPETFFLRGADCWGWATWARGWKLYEPDGAKLLLQLNERGLTHAFDFDGSYPYTQMLRDQVEGKNNSWAIRWHASAFLRGKLSLYPGVSLVNNIGLDATGAHCGRTTRFDSRLAQSRVRVERLDLMENQLARERFVSYFMESHSSIQRFFKKIGI